MLNQKLLDRINQYYGTNLENRELTPEEQARMEIVIEQLKLEQARLVQELENEKQDK